MLRQAGEQFKVRLDGFCRQSCSVKAHDPDMSKPSRPSQPRATLLRRVSLRCMSNLPVRGRSVLFPSEYYPTDACNYSRMGYRVIAVRKRLISQTLPSPRLSPQAWLNLDRTASVEVTSEENGYPIESALLGDEKHGWRAADAGIQTIRLIFDEPQKLRRIWLVFEDTENTRTQEFVLRWSADTGHSSREIVRQQWNFSPPNEVRETEDYAVELPGVKTLELVIVPDIKAGEARASLANLRLA